jgi:peptidoglycan/LPS O-acetylase OafA/YrhL
MDQTATIRDRVEFSHVPALDGIRAMAVLLVMVYHMEYLVPELHTFVKGGFLGVDIFFVLSGFLITSILLKEQDETGGISLWSFYLRRTLRLIPAFWLFLIVLYFLGDTLLPPIEAEVIYSQNNFLYSFFYTMNLHRASGGITGNLNHTWSLAIEEQFYIIWSLVLFKAFAEFRSRRHIAVGTGVAILILVFHRAIRTYLGTSFDVLYYSTEMRIDAILIGCLASMLFFWKLIPTRAFHTRTFSRIALGATVGALLILLTISHKDRALFYGISSLFSVLTAIGLLWLAVNETTRVHRILENAVLRWLGQISYGLYLWHYLFYEFAKAQVGSEAMQVIVAVSCSLIVSSLSFYCLERYVLKIKSHISRQDVSPTPTLNSSMHPHPANPEKA